MKNFLSVLLASFLLVSPALAGKRSENRAPASLCDNAKCPMAMIHCPHPKKRIDVRKPGACCPKWKCVDKDELTDDAMASDQAEEEEAEERE